MSKKEFLSRLGVCSWSLRPTGANQLLFLLLGLGIRKFQCALDPIRQTPKSWRKLQSLCADQAVILISGMFGTIGEDYSTLASIKRTGGIVPDATWDDNWQLCQQTAALAQQLGLRLVSFHAGFLPPEPADPDYRKLLHRVRLIADLFADHGIDLALETGQEKAVHLSVFLEALNRKNVGVNFDPANLILYDQGDPIAALPELGPWLKQCHLKDAVRTQTQGTWGQEVVLGTGEVDWRAFIRTLAALHFCGYLCIERETGDQRVEDIRTARDYITRIIEEVVYD